MAISFEVMFGLCRVGADAFGKLMQIPLDVVLGREGTIERETVEVTNVDGVFLRMEDCKLV
jgi:hypothetical protein